MIRAAIVNDLPMAVEALRRALAASPDVEVAWVAKDGAEAVEKCARDTPDVVLMDLIMPVMDGVEATRRIMRQSPCAILVVTATVSGNAGKVFEAMGHGALDAAPTPVLGPEGDVRGGEEILRKINIISRLLRKPAGVKAARTAPAAAPNPYGGEPPPLVVIGASTGGPKALAAILSALPPNLGAALVVVQHVDQRFAGGMADWLGRQCPFPVRAAGEGERPAPGLVQVAATNDHLILRRDLSLAYAPEPADYPYRPSVDVFFESAAAHWPAPGVAALLTGMGRDGARGLLRLKRAGWLTLAQDEASSVVYGMPKAAAELGAAVKILPLAEMAGAIVNAVTTRRPFHAGTLPLNPS